MRADGEPTLMHATALFESYQGPHHLRDEVPLRDAAACGHALDRLGHDGACGLSADRGGPRALMVGGGPERFRACLWDQEADRGCEACDPGAEPGATVELVTGGQAVTVLLRETAGRAAARAALVAFAEGGQRAAGVAWVANG